MTSAMELFNRPLIGVPGGRERLETPALILDVDIFNANLVTVERNVTKAGLRLRPHAKSHKCAEIARRQLAAGAIGIACAKPGELIALFEAGIRPLMLTAPVSDPRKIARLAAAAAAGADLTVVVDRPGLASAYGEAARREGVTIAALVDCDTGLGRSGVAHGSHAVSLARHVAAEEGLVYAGLQAYAGHVQHVHDFTERRRANDEANRRLSEIIAALAAAGLPPGIVSGGGTGSHLLDAEAGILTEIQAGSYCLMDEGYLPVDIDGQGGTMLPPSLFVAVGVVGHSSSGQAITDGGTKSFAVDGPAPRVFHRGREIGTIAWAGDEFGRVMLHPGLPVPPAGALLECTAPHCDPTINLHEVLHVVRGDRLEDIWTLEARGRSD